VRAYACALKRRWSLDIGPIGCERSTVVLMADSNVSLSHIHAPLSPAAVLSLQPIQGEFTPKSALFITVNKSWQKRVLRDKKEGNIHDAMIADSDTVLETAIYFDAENRRLVTADLPLLDEVPAASRNNEFLKIAPSFVLDVSLNRAAKVQPIVGATATKTIYEDVSSICQHPNRLDIFGSTNGRSVRVWRWLGAFHPNSIKQGEVSEEKCFYTPVDSTTHNRYLSFVPHTSKVMLCRLVEIEITSSSSGPRPLYEPMQLYSMFELHIDEVFSSRTICKTQETLPFRLICSIGISAGAIFNPFSRQLREGSGSLVSSVCCGLSGQSLIVCGRGLLSVYRLELENDSTSSDQPLNAELKLIEHLSDVFDEFEHAEIKHAIAVSPSARQASKLGSYGLDQYIVLLGSGQIYSFEVRLRAAHSGLGVEAYVDENRVLRVNQSPMPMIDTLLCPWKEVGSAPPPVPPCQSESDEHPMTLRSKSLRRQGSQPGLLGPTRRHSSSSVGSELPQDAVIQRRTNREPGSLYSLGTQGDLEQYCQDASGQWQRNEETSCQFGPSQSNKPDPSRPASLFVTGEFGRVQQQRVVLIDATSKNMVISRLDVDAPLAVIRLPN